MKVCTNICALFGMLFFLGIAQGQDSYKKYMRPKSAFTIDTVFNTASKDFSTNPTNHLWLNSLNSQYVDTTKNKINSSAIPAYVPIKKNSLLNPYSAANQIIGALLPYGNYFPNPQYGPATYYPVNKTYPALPYGYSPYNISAPGSPYYILPKF